MHSILDRYFAVNPRALNPFNAPNREFAPTDDPEADADYLARVASGESSRFYVTLSEIINRPGRYRVVVKDAHNGNVLYTRPPAPLGKAAALAGYDDHLLAGVQACVNTAAALGVDFRPDLALVHSDIGRGHGDLLLRYAEGEPARFAMAEAV